MKNKNKKAYYSVLFLMISMVVITIFFIKFDKQFVIKEGQLQAIEYDPISYIDAKSEQQSLQMQLNNAITYFDQQSINTVILSFNQGNQSVVEVPGFENIYANTSALQKQDMIDYLKQALAKRNIQLFVKMDCSDLSDQQILNGVKHLYKEYALAGIVIDNYTKEKDFLQQLKMTINKSYKKYSLFLQTQTVAEIDQVLAFGAIDGYVIEDISFEEYNSLKSSVLLQEKLLLHHQSPILASNVFMLSNFSALDGAVLAQYVPQQPDLTLLATDFININQLPMFNFSVQSDFEITYPQENINTVYSGIYLTGTGQANGVVSVNGVEYPAAKDGTFGIYCDLELGENEIKVQQNGVEKTVIVTRKKGSLVNKPTQWDDTKKAAQGQIVETIGPLTSVISNKNNDSTIIAGLAEGTKLMVQASEKTLRGGKNTYAYKLSGGGYVLAKNVKWVKSENYTQPIITKVETYDTDKNDEILTFQVQNRPAIISSLSNEGITLQFLDTKIEDISFPQSKLYSYVSVKQEDNNAVVFLGANPQQPVWGYDITQDENTASVYLKAKPTLNVGAEPLKGITILLDPGHGAQDSGALGVSGGKGPAEKDLNLALAKATKACLEKYGATVLLTRDTDVFYTLEERRTMVKTYKPDLFISLHHNSMDYYYNSTNAVGSECYYFTEQSKAFAQTMVENIALTTGRLNRGAKYGYYYVTRTDIAPSVLMEYSFLINPQEYANTYSDANIYKAAYGTTQAVLKMFQTK